MNCTSQIYLLTYLISVNAFIHFLFKLHDELTIIAIIISLIKLVRALWLVNLAGPTLLHGHASNNYTAIFKLKLAFLSNQDISDQRYDSM